MTSKKKLPVLIAEALDENTVQLKRAKELRTLAVNFAQALNTTVELVHVEAASLFSEPDFEHFFKEYRSEKMRRVKALAQSLGTKTKAVFLSGDPFVELGRLCSTRSRYELIALATHGRKGLSRMVLGSVTEDIIRSSKIPVLSLGPNVKLSNQSFFAKTQLKIVVGTDVGRGSLRAEAYAADLALRLNAQLVLVHCLYEGFEPIHQIAFKKSNRPNELTQLYEKMKLTAIKTLERKKKRFEMKGIETLVLLETESLSSADVILGQIKNHRADFVVLGTHARNFLTGALLGSTARKVILDSSTPVITLK